MTDTVCIVNPRAGGGRTAHTWSGLVHAFEKAGGSCDVRLTAAPGHGTLLAREALREGATTVIAMGGDGTIHEVVNGFFEDGQPLAPHARLGIIPRGSGSDLIKTLGIPADGKGAIARILAGRTRRLDLGRTTYMAPDRAKTSRYFVNSCSVGMTGAVMARMASLPAWLSGSPRYAAASVFTFFQFRAMACDIAVDGTPLPTDPALMVVVGNSRYFGGGMHVLPQAVPDDGLLDVMVLRERPVLELLLNFPRIYLGTHQNLPMVEMFRGRQVTIAAATPLLLEIDGEQPGTTPIAIEVVPHAIEVLV